MNRHDLFKYRDKKKLLTNMANDIEAEREKLYKTTPLYEERYGGTFRDKIADGVIELIEKEEYYKEDMKEMAKELRLVEMTWKNMRREDYKNILYLRHMSPEYHSIHDIWEKGLLSRSYNDEKYVSKLYREALDAFDSITPAPPPLNK